MLKLHPHKSNPLSDFSCLGRVKENGKQIVLNFQVQNYVANIGSFSKDYKQNTGLWDFDVCEAFLSFSSPSYLEVQASANDEPFAYLVKKPREEFSLPKYLDLEIESTICDSTWSCEMRVSKKNIPGTGKLIGNLFVCLGKKEARSYFALNINCEAQADFHRPDLFKELL